MTEQPPSASSLWTDLVEKDDRTSPEEYPDMALITFDEFQYLLERYAAQRVSAETERCAKIAEEAADYVSAGKPFVVIPARTFASDLALDIRDAIRAKGKQT